MNTTMKMILVLTLITVLSGGVLSTWDGFTKPKIFACFPISRSARVLSPMIPCKRKKIGWGIKKINPTTTVYFCFLLRISRTSPNMAAAGTAMVVNSGITVVSTSVKTSCVIGKPGMIS